MNVSGRSRVARGRPGGHPVAAIPQDSWIADVHPPFITPSPARKPDPHGGLRMIFRPKFASLFAVLALVGLSGCAQKADQTASGASSDSLLAASPIEPQQGQLQPQTDFQPQTTPPATTPAVTTPPPAPKATPAPAPKPKPVAPTATVAAGTALKIAMTGALSSETAAEGQSWSGTMSEAVTVGNLAPFPAGSTVHGVVESVKAAAKGDRALLILRVTSIEANGKTH